MSKNVLVAMSGGVDSAGAAIELLEAGYSVYGLFMVMSEHHFTAAAEARKTADALGIPLFQLDLRERFEEIIIDGFVREYVAGRTPNPCVICNAELKFAELLRMADEKGCEWAATGHYAGRAALDGQTLIARSENLRRDQSYMLYRLGGAAVSRLLFPIGNMEKERVREKVRARGLDCFDAPDSSENCFIPDNDYKAFISARIGGGDFSGEIISPEGEVCGRHTGIFNYTIGQRKGLGAFGRPVFVRRIEPDSRRVYLAFGGDEYAGQVEIGDCVWHTGADSFRCSVKIRSAAAPADAVVYKNGGGAQIVFDRPQRAAAPGQSAVCYAGDIVIGGGIIR